jgi:hypothetical protein
VDWLVIADAGDGDGEDDILLDDEFLYVVKK